MAKKNPKTELRLDGKVSIVENVGRKDEKSFDIDPKLVLELILVAIREGLDKLDADRSFNKRLSNPRRKGVSQRNTSATT